MTTTPKLRPGRNVSARDLRHVIEDGAEHDRMLTRCIARAQRRAHRVPRVRRPREASA